MKTGIDLITQERQEQIEKHRFSLNIDQRNDQGELINAATFLLTGDIGFYPASWSHKFALKFKRKLASKNKIESLKVAGALIAAEIDRIQMANSFKNFNHWIAALRSLALAGIMYSEDNPKPMGKKDIDYLFNKYNFKDRFEEGMTPQEAFRDEMGLWDDNQ